MSSDKKNSDQHNEPSVLEADIAKLASIVASNSEATNTNGNGTGEPETVNGEELGMEEVEELIRRMEAANGIADGVEDKLDGILQHLDGLLSSLDAKGETKVGSGPAESRQDR